MTPNSTIISSWIEAKSVEKIDRAAEECDQSRSAFLKAIIEAYIEENPRDLNALNSQPDPQSETLDSYAQNETPASFVEDMLNDFE